MLYVEFLLVVFQVGVIICTFRLNHQYESVAYKKYLGPFVWFSFFYSFWFLLPQLLSVFPPYLLVGFESEGESYRSSIVITGQFAIMIFLLGVCLGYTLYPGRAKSRILMDVNSFVEGVRRWEYFLLFGFYLMGVLATAYLGNTFQSIEGMRSELVKSSSGQLITAISFYGNFGFSVLFAIFLLKKNYILSLVLLLIFASSILLTGARGRLLWPLVLAFSFVFVASRNKFPVFKVFLLGLSLLVVLLLLDPLMISIREGDFTRFSDSLNLAHLLESLIYRRNFDSFANLTGLVFYDEVSYEWSRFFLGARDAFMYQYYPVVYDSGVGFGVTFPGAMFLSGGYFALGMGSLLFGFFLRAYGLWFSSINNGRIFWAYLFSVPWVCGVGGNFSESFDKLIVAMSPAVVWFLLSKVLRMKVARGRLR